MTILELAHAPARLDAILNRARALSARIAAFADALSERIAQRDAERTLKGMSDHMLKDIGISRADIHRRVRGLD